VIPHADAQKFAQVHRRRWEEGAIKIGTSAGAAAFWCSAAPEEGICVLTGHDDQTWDVAFTISVGCLQEIIAELDKIADSEGD
jgi:hypothetical protein